MTYSLLSGLVIFCLVSSITPGPNNLMLLASGANFGIRRTLPHMLGVVLGFTFMVIVIGLGAAQVFQRIPVAHSVLTIVSVFYLLYLAYKIGTANSKVLGEKVTGSPITFLQAVFFQWVNPKTWAMAITAITVYIGDAGLFFLGIAACIFGIVNIPSMLLWTTLGQQMARILKNPTRLKVFNWTMAALLVASLYPVLQMG